MTQMTGSGQGARPPAPRRAPPAVRGLLDELRRRVPAAGLQVPQLCQGRGLGLRRGVQVAGQEQLQTRQPGAEAPRQRRHVLAAQVIVPAEIIVRRSMHRSSHRILSDGALSNAVGQLSSNATVNAESRGTQHLADAVGRCAEDASSTVTRSGAHESKSPSCALMCRAAAAPPSADCTTSMSRASSHQLCAARPAAASLSDAAVASSATAPPVRLRLPAFGFACFAESALGTGSDAALVLALTPEATRSSAASASSYSAVAAASAAVGSEMYSSRILSASSWRSRAGSLSLVSWSNRRQDRDCKYNVQPVRLRAPRAACKCRQCSRTRNLPPAPLPRAQPAFTFSVSFVSFHPSVRAPAGWRRGGSAGRRARRRRTGPAAPPGSAACAAAGAGPPGSRRSWWPLRRATDARQCNAQPSHSCMTPPGMQVTRATPSCVER